MAPIERTLRGPVRPSRTCTKGLRPLDSILRNLLSEKPVLFPGVAGKSEKVRLDAVRSVSPALQAETADSSRQAASPGVGPGGSSPWCGSGAHSPSGPLVGLSLCSYITLDKLTHRWKTGSKHRQRRCAERRQEPSRRRVSFLFARDSPETIRGRV